MKIRQGYLIGFIILLYIIFFTSILNVLYQFHQALFLAILNGVFHLLIVYLNNYWLIPSVLKHKKYTAYIASVLILIVSLAFFRAYIEFTYLDFIPEKMINTTITTPQNNNTGFLSAIFPSMPPDFPYTLKNQKRVFFPPILLSNILIWSIAFSFYFAKEWFDSQRLEVERKNETLETELKFLKNQLNPHFLFNTLNNIYSYTYIKDERAAPMLMQLSEMLRYMLYDCNESRVTMEKELQFLKNFIDLQKMKTDKVQTIDCEIDNHIQSFKIAPLLLLPFFENSFKHSDLDSNPYGFIKIRLQFKENKTLYFEIENTKRKNKSNQKENSGIGLENVKKRLELLYPQQFDLQINENEQTFKINLILELI